LLVLGGHEVEGDKGTCHLHRLIAWSYDEERILSQR
jgi:hypothetical protein